MPGMERPCMNERIFELSIQANREFDEHVAECEQLGKQIEWVTEERLVELVVRECADLVDRAISDGGVDGRVVKEHFGVE